MNNYEKPSERPEGGKFYGFDHIHFWVGNAKQAAAFYTSHFGMEYCAYRGLETGVRDVVTHVVRTTNGKVFFAFSSPYHEAVDPEMDRHIVKHGDGVRDIAFHVEDCRALYKKCMSKGAVSISEPKELKDENGSVIIASIRAYADTVHTFVERVDYKGPFLPGYIPHHSTEHFNKFIKPTEFIYVDHCVGNQPDLQMTPVVEFYEKVLDFHRFWSVDDSIMHTEYSALRSTVVSDFDEAIKMPINEPAVGKRKSQIQEYVDYYHSGGVQHVALKVGNIIETIENLRSRGLEFLEVPDTYYDILRKNIPHMTIQIKENIDHLQKNKILVDYDDKGYLLQLFTKPVEDRPTLFYEFIQRNNHSGFGAGNFKSLFESLELEQSKRGNLIEEVKATMSY